jgi:hypothetical protein
MEGRGMEPTKAQRMEQAARAEQDARLCAASELLQAAEAARDALRLEHHQPDEMAEVYKYLCSASQSLCNRCGGKLPQPIHDALHLTVQTKQRHYGRFFGPNELSAVVNALTNYVQQNTVSLPDEESLLTHDEPGTDASIE